MLYSINSSKLIDFVTGSGKLAADNMLTILKPFFAGGQIDAYSARQQAIAQVPELLLDFFD